MRIATMLAVASAAVAVAACSESLVAPSSAANIAGPHFTVTFDPSTGSGFVGKGDVQYTLIWNNQQLQANYKQVDFRSQSTVVTEVSWICTNSNNDKDQARLRTTTTTVSGLVTTLARDSKKQITGFNLTGYDGSTTQNSSSEGPSINSCPAGSGWSLTTPAGDPVEVINSTTMDVTGDSSSSWTLLLEKPVIV